MQVRIYKPTKTTMQSGMNKDKWVMEFVIPPASRFIEPILARTSSRDMMNEVKIEFASSSDAVRFAEEKGYNYEIITPNSPKLIKKSYASNFK